MAVLGTDTLKMSDFKISVLGLGGRGFCVRGLGFVLWDDPFSRCFFFKVSRIRLF